MSKNRIGETHTLYDGSKITIIDYFSSTDCTIRLENDILLHKVRYSEIVKGNVKNPLSKSVHNVGYIGIGTYKSRIDGKVSKIYRCWKNLLKRCYNKNLQNSNPSYIGCHVNEEWHNFQNFAQWYEDNYNPEYMKGWQLDKDILVKGNKAYSSKTCCFVPQEINMQFSGMLKDNRETVIGVLKKRKKFKAQIGKKYLGSFDTPEEAFQAYKEAKEQYIKEVADKWKNLISDKVYQAMYSYEVKITD